MKNDGKNYELLTQEIFQQLAAQREVSNIDVRHNITLPGKFCDHQIDVYWEFEAEDINYRYVIECKDWQSATVKQNALFAFKAILDDLDNPIGVFVTRKGFQHGALKYAAAHGIILYQLSEEPEHSPIEIKEGSFADMKLRPADWISEVTIYEVANQNVKFQMDMNWFREIKEKFGADFAGKLSKYKTPPLTPKQAKFYNDQGEEVSSLFDITRPLADAMYRTKETERKKISHSFTHPTFLSIALEEVPFVKIESVSFDIVIEKQPMFESPMRLKGFVGFILKNIFENTSKRFLIKE